MTAFLNTVPDESLSTSLLSVLHHGETGLYYCCNSVLPWWFAIHTLNESRGRIAKEMPNIKDNPRFIDP